MKKVIFVYGSPKPEGSVSGLLLDALTDYLPDTEIEWLDLSDTDDRACQALRQADAAVLSFPLYFDSIPSHVLDWMVRAQAQLTARSRCRVYAIINCSLYEGSQCQWAAQSVRHWTLRCGMTWGQALCVGGGPLLQRRSALGHGLRNAVGQGVHALADQILAGESDDDLFVSPKLPRLVYQLSSWSWHKQARGRSDPR